VILKYEDKAEYRKGQRLQYDIGEGKVFTTPPMPDRDEFLFTDNKKRDQKWIRPLVPPRNYEELTDTEKIRLISLDMKRRQEGLWFFNNGEPTYITGDHYFYLTHWFIGADTCDGYPQYRRTNRFRAYHWQFCKDDPNCYGDTYITNRRDGKTEMMLAFSYNDLTLNDNKHMGLQSISMADARDNLFQQRIVRSWKMIHPDFKPVSDDPDPKTVLRFTEAITKKKKEKTEYKQSLNSWIDYQESRASAYQGKRLFRICIDEPGAMENMDLEEWWKTTKKTLTLGVKVWGKAMLPTTLESMKRKGGVSFRNLWYKSDYNKKDSNGRTQSGLYRYFKAGYLGLEGFVDEYGDDIIDEDGVYKAKKYLLNERAGASPEDLDTLKRQYPFTPEEALFSEEHSVFPVSRINDQKIYNESLPNGILRKGNFIWADEGRTKVEFVDDPNGRWYIAWMPPLERRNAYDLTYKGREPKNIMLGGIGVDPFDHNKTVDGKGSNGAIYVFRKFDPNEPLRSNCFVCEYVNRPLMAKDFWEDVAKTCVFYGMKALIENQKPGCVQWMLANGFKHYVEHIQQNEFTKSNSRTWTAGMSMSGEGARESHINGLVSYMYRYIGKIENNVQVDDYGFAPDEVMAGLYGFCPFNTLLDDWTNFNIEKWTDYDSTVASGLALMQSKRTKIVRTDDGQTRTMLFPTYNISGNQSVKNKG